MAQSQRGSAVFVEQFEQQPDLLVCAPGCFSFIGEHADNMQPNAIDCTKAGSEVIA